MLGWARLRLEDGPPLCKQGTFQPSRGLLFMPTLETPHSTVCVWCQSQIQATHWGTESRAGWGGCTVIYIHNQARDTWLRMLPRWEGVRGRVAPMGRM